MYNIDYQVYIGAHIYHTWLCHDISYFPLYTHHGNTFMYVLVCEHMCNGYSNYNHKK